MNEPELPGGFWAAIGTGFRLVVKLAGNAAEFYTIPVAFAGSGPAV